MLFWSCLLTLSGCAHSYLDENGNRRVTGWVDMTLPPESSAIKGADWMRFRTIGIALSSTAIGTALELGYSDNAVIVVPNNRCVLIDRLPWQTATSTGGDHGYATKEP
jgi:hypothetical protein